MRSLAALVLLALLLLPLAPLAGGAPSEWRARVLEERGVITSVLGLENAPLLLVALYNHTLHVYRGLSLARSLDVADYGYVIRMAHPSGSRIAVLGTSKGYVLLLDLDRLEISGVHKVGDSKILLLDATGEPPLVAVAIRRKLTVSGRRVDSEYLVVYNTSSREVVFYRGWESRDKLAKVYKLKILGNRYLVLETLDKFCELCEVVEGRLEIYDLETLELVYSRALGVSIDMDVGDERTVVSIRRRLRAKGYTTMVHVLELGEEVRELEYELPVSPLSVELLNEDRYALACSKEGRYYVNVYNLRGRRSRSFQCDYKIVLLEESGDKLLVGGPGYLSAYSSKSLLWNLQLCVPALAPRAVGAYGGGRYAYAAYKDALCLYERRTFHRLVVRILDPEGSPLSGAEIEVLEGERLVAESATESGEAVFSLRAGTYTVRISAEGFETVEREVELLRDSEIVITLKPPTVEKERLLVEVVDEEGRPIFASIRVTRVDGGLVEQLVTIKGTVVLELERGEYNLTAVAEGYEPNSTVVEIPGTSVVRLVLEPLEYELVVCVRGCAATAVVEVVEPGGGVAARKELSLEGGGACTSFRLKMGTYEVLVRADGGGRAERVSLRRGNANVEIDVGCSTRVSGNLEAAMREVEARLREACASVLEVEFEAPDFEARDYNGALVRLSDYRGKVVVLDFFYTQCEGCKSLIPVLREITEKLGDRVVVLSITVSQTDTPEIVEEYAREYNVTWTILHDDAGIYLRYNVSLFPTVVVVDEDGIARFVALGSKKSVEETWSTLSGLLSRISENPEILLLVAGAVLFLIGSLPVGAVGEEEEELSLYDY